MPKGARDLQAEVLDKNLCTGCGMCVGMCPYIKTVDEKVAVIHPCGLEDGNCYRVCPRTATDLSQLDRQVFGEKRDDAVLGRHTALLFARAADVQVAGGGQYGGTVSALTVFALEQGDIDAAVLTRGNGGSYPAPRVVRSREEVLACAGSKYSACPTMTGFHQAVGEGSRRTGVVGRPCQVTAVRKLQGLAAGDGVPHLPAGTASLVIGLFCFWALDPGFYRWLAARVDPQQVLAIDIPLEGLEVRTAERVYRWPVDEVRPFIRPACLQCFDSTAEFADVSVGSTEYDPEWNTLVVRTRRGADLVERARQAGVLEVKPYPEERIPILRQAVLNKKIRVLRLWEDGQAAYLQVDDADKEQILGLEVQAG
ncbi:hypothetical protein SY88_15770 [Clostridiales bacterium PH28_bin88]|nr:hypothetical protein SY88_15770 [Clostridiales bacterium PH28_bin88]